MGMCGATRSLCYNVVLYFSKSIQAISFSVFPIFFETNRIFCRQASTETNKILDGGKYKSSHH